MDCLDTSIWHSSDFLPLKSGWHLSGKDTEAQPAALLPLPRLNNHSKPTHSSEHLLSHKETSHVVCYHTSRGGVPSQEYTARLVSFLSEIRRSHIKGCNFRKWNLKNLPFPWIWNASWISYQFTIHVGMNLKNWGCSSCMSVHCRSFTTLYVYKIWFNWHILHSMTDDDENLDIRPITLSCSCWDYSFRKNTGFENNTKCSLTIQRGRVHEEGLNKIPSNKYFAIYWMSRSFYWIQECQ